MLRRPEALEAERKPQPEHEQKRKLTARILAVAKAIHELGLPDPGALTRPGLRRRVSQHLGSTVCKTLFDEAVKWAGLPSKRKR